MNLTPNEYTLLARLVEITRDDAANPGEVFLAVPMPKNGLMLHHPRCFLGTIHDPHMLDVFADAGMIGRRRSPHGLQSFIVTQRGVDSVLEDWRQVLALAHEPGVQLT